MVKADIKRLNATWKLLQSWHDAGHCRAIAAETGDAHSQVHPFFAGRLAAPETAGKVRHDSIFLIASPTKPFVATAVMKLVEGGELQLDHSVQRYLPEFRGHGKKAVRLIHLLTHTSGLPDMLPNNEQLRKSHAPLSEFMKHVCSLELLDKPGRRVQYQSMGILALATVVERVTGSNLSDWLRQQIFEPLEMTNTALGMPAAWESDGHIDKMAWSQIDDLPHAEDWGWNSLYWRKLGPPWGGLLSTVADLGRFCRHLLQIHAGNPGILAPATLRAMTTNQLVGLSELSERAVQTTPWGLGWQINWPGHSRGFGSLVSRQCYGHWGATGTMLWLDPTRGVYGIILTTEPITLENRRQIAFGNMSSLIW